MDGQNKMMVENISYEEGRGLIVTGKVIEGTILIDMKCFDVRGKEAHVKEIKNINQPNADYLKYSQRGSIVIDNVSEEDVRGKDTLSFI